MNPQSNTERSRRWRLKNPEANKAQKQKYNIANLARLAFWNQQAQARIRGIMFDLTYQQWIDWWGADIDKRGRSNADLVMARYEDVGPYALDNIYKTTGLANRLGPQLKGECNDR